MLTATTLTREGRLNEATLAIQKSLATSAGCYKTVAGERSFPSSSSSSPPPPPPPPPPAHKQLHGSVSNKFVNYRAPDNRSYIDRSGKTPPASFQNRHTHPVRPAVGQSGFSSGEFTHAGMSIPYRLYIPSTTNIGPMPLLLLLHGCTQDAADFATGTAMNAIADRNGMAVLYPSQTVQANANKCWNWFEPAHQCRGRGEPAALSALTRLMMSTHGFDPQRVFVAGMSAGGAMAVVLGEQYPELFAAVGIHSGLPTGVASNVMEALGAMKGGSDPMMHQPLIPAIQRVTAPTSAAVQPTIVFHGAKDRTVDAANAQTIVTNCLKRASKVDSHITSQYSKTVSGPDAVTVTTHRDSTQRVICEYWHLHAAGHRWSGGDPAGTHTDAKGPDASAEMVRFFLSSVATKN